MFFSLTPQDIANSKTTIFPLMDDFNIKSLVVSGNDDRNVFNMSFIVRDNYKTPKIFNVLDAKKFMRMKIIAISSSDIKSQLAATNSLEQILDIVNNNNLFNLDVNVGYDFNGSKTDIKDHIVQGDYILLNYLINFQILNKINYLSFGLIFYYDYSEYFNDKEILEKDANKNLLSGDIKFFDLYENGKISAITGIQDLKILNSLFNENQNINKIATEAAVSTKLINILSQNKPKKVKTGQYFSNIYISRKNNSQIGLLFNINQYKLLKENTSYSKYLENTVLEDQIMSKATVKSIKILRREIDWNTGKPKNNTLKNIIFSSQKNRYIAKNDSEDGYINEIDLASDEGNRVFTIEALDKKIFANKIGVFEYGVEMSISDGFTDYVKRLIDSLLEDEKKINYYLSETDKIVYSRSILLENNPHNEKTTKSLNGYYDSKNNRFTDYFKAFVYPQLHQDNVLNSITNFVTVIKLFKNITNEDELIRCLVNTLNPATSTFNSISFFINLQKRFISLLKNVIKTNINSEINFEHWFKNDYVDVEMSSEIGYDFLNINTDGFSGITGEQLKNRIDKEILKFSSENLLPPNQQNNAICFLSPNRIHTKNYKLDLNNIITDPEYYSPFNYSEVELDIKRENIIGSSDKQITLSYNSNASLEEIQNFKLKINNIFNRMSIKTNNLLVENDQTRQLFLKGSNANTYLENNNVDPTLLYIGLSKNINLEKQIFKNKKIPLYTNIKDTAERAELNNQYPYHLDLLRENKCKIFSNTDNILNNISLNSKFLLLFNTIHSIEILNFTNENIKSEKWSLMTSDLVNSLNPADTYLCRLKLFQNKIFSLDSFEDIKMHIYDQYFILKDIRPLQSIEYPVFVTPTAEKVFTINKEKINISPIVSRYSTSIQQIPIFTPKPISSEESEENGSTPVAIYLEDQPVVDTKKMLITNIYPLAWPDGEAPTEITGPDLYYKSATGLPDNSFKKIPVMATSDSGSVIEGEWVKIPNYGAEPDVKMFSDGRIYSIAFDFNQIVKKHNDEKQRREAAAAYAEKIKSFSEPDAADTTNEFGQSVLAFARHYSIGNNQRLGRGNIGSGQHFQLLSSNRKYVFSIDIAMKTFAVINLQSNKALWAFSSDLINDFRLKGGLISGVTTGAAAGAAYGSFAVGIGTLIGAGIGALAGGISALAGTVNDNELGKKGIGSVYFNDSQMQIYDSNNSEIYIQLGPHNKFKKETAYMIMQDDGNLVVYDGDNNPVWDTGTQNDTVTIGPKNLVFNGKAPEVFVKGMAGAQSAIIK